MFNTASPASGGNPTQGSNNNAKKGAAQADTGGIITLKPNKQRTQGRKSKFNCVLL